MIIQTNNRIPDGELKRAIRELVDDKGFYGRYDA